MIDIINQALQRDINIICNKKVTRSGKLINFSQKDFYIVLILKIKDVNRKYEIPYPFEIIKTDNGFIFDYKVSTLTKDNKKRYDMFINLPRVSSNKFFNNELTVEYI